MSNFSVSLYGYWGSYPDAKAKIEKIGVSLPHQEVPSIPINEIVIFTPKSFLNMTKEQINKIMILRKRDIINSLSTGSHVCVLVNNDLDSSFFRILDDFGIKFSKLDKEIQQLKIKRSEFDTFLNKYGTAFGAFPYSTFTSVICTIENNSGRVSDNNLYKKEVVVGMSRKHSNGIITLLPFLVHDNTYYHGDDWDIIIPELVRALKTHRANLIFEMPKWVSDIKLKEENKLEQEINFLDSQMQEKKKQYEYQINLKSVLWLKHNELRNAAMKLLNELDYDTEEDIYFLVLVIVVVAAFTCDINLLLDESKN